MKYLNGSDIAGSYIRQTRSMVAFNVSFTKWRISQLKMLLKTRLKTVKILYVQVCFLFICLIYKTSTSGLI